MIIEILTSLLIQVSEAFLPFSDFEKSGFMNHLNYAEKSPLLWDNAKAISNQHWKQDTPVPNRNQQL